MSENRLSRETSPYLLQHQDNPVHWWAWGPEALAEARQTGKPILLSVGYAACHWCHVMAHESFEDQATADVMNGLFVCIKVDREERPDIDAIYMGALHRLGEQGGWPLTMFLDTDAKPFWGGTYFPKDGRYGKPPFVNVLRQAAHIYANDRETVDHNAQLITGLLAERSPADASFAITDQGLEDLCARLLRAVDGENGGLQGAPKFPQWNFFWLLWRGAIRYDQPLVKAAVEKTLIHICQGGIYDHLGGGFARYAVDERWLVPHFEKMLYDNALLIDLMTEVYRETGNRLFEVRIAETVAWLEREMIAPGGAFAASLDADSEGEEGKFYVWTYDELVAVLGADVAKVFGQIYDVKPGGNWEGHSILNRLASRELMSDAEEDKLAILKRKLMAVRDQRIRPGFDDKVLADWNGLMIAALAKAGVVFERPEWIVLARQAFAFVEAEMMVEGRLAHSARAGKLNCSATASDYANMIGAAMALHQATLEEGYLAAALTWEDVLARHYWDGPDGGYATTADDADDVIVRMRVATDGAEPNANAMMLANLMGLFLVTGDVGFVERAEAVHRAFSGDVRRAMTQHAGFLANSVNLIAPQLVVISNGVSGDGLFEAALKTGLPGAMVYRLDDAANYDLAGLAGKLPVEGQAAAYVCLGSFCAPPVLNAGDLKPKLRELRRAARPGSI